MATIKALALASWKIASEVWVGPLDCGLMLRWPMPGCRGGKAR